MEPPARARPALHHRLRRAAPRSRRRYRDAGARPRGHRDQGADADRAVVSVARPLDGGHDPAQEVRRVQGRGALRHQPHRQRALPRRRAGHRIAPEARGCRLALARRHAEVQDAGLPARPRGDDAAGHAPPGQGGHRRSLARAAARDEGRRVSDPPPEGRCPHRLLVDRAVGQAADEGPPGARGTEHRHRQEGDGRDGLRRPRRARAHSLRAHVGLPGRRLQGDARARLRVRSHPRQEAPGRGRAATAPR